MDEDNGTSSVAPDFMFKIKIVMKNFSRLILNDPINVNDNETDCLNL